MSARFRTFLIAPAFVLAAGCSKDKAADPTLNSDLTLAAQARQNAVLDSVSAAERMKAANVAAAATAPVVAAPAPVAPAPVRRTARTHTTGSGTTTSTSGGNVAAAEPRTVTEKHTNRDAAIGAGAGAIIGATTSGNKVKGGLIGAAVGGILGGVVGNNVDKKKHTVP